MIDATILANAIKDKIFDIDETDWQWIGWAGNPKIFYPVRTFPLIFRIKSLFKVKYRGKNNGIYAISKIEPMDGGIYVHAERIHFR